MQHAKLERREGEKGIQITMHVLFGISKSMLQLVLMTVIFDRTFTETLHICRFKMLSFVSCSGICVIKHIKREYKNFRFKNVSSVYASNVLQMCGSTLHCPHPRNTQCQLAVCTILYASPSCCAIFKPSKAHTHKHTHTHAHTLSCSHTLMLTHMARMRTHTHSRTCTHTCAHTHTSSVFQYTSA